MPKPTKAGKLNFYSIRTWAMPKPIKVGRLQTNLSNNYYIPCLQATIKLISIISSNMGRQGVYFHQGYLPLQSNYFNFYLQIMKNRKIFATRTGFSNREMENFYGPLANLIGIWSGNKGVNLIAVPDQKGDFKLLVRPYSETLTITPVSSPTPNRGLKEIQQLPTLMYSLSIYDSIDNSLMHIENGIWELLDKKVDDGFDLAHIATVPHGDAILALGNSSVVAKRPPIDPDLSALPTPIGNFSLPLGYTEGVYTQTSVEGFDNSFPNRFLIDYLDKQEQEGLVISKTTNLVVSTHPHRHNRAGGILNIPSIQRNANATELDLIFWIETVQDQNTGKNFLQLQYSQNIAIEFPIASTPKGATIKWPHINVNTLIKQ